MSIPIWFLFRNHALCQYFFKWVTLAFEYGEDAKIAAFRDPFNPPADHLEESYSRMFPRRIDDRPAGLLSHADGSGLFPEARPKVTALSWKEIRLATYKLNRPFSDQNLLIDPNEEMKYRSSLETTDAIYGSEGTQSRGGYADLEMRNRIGGKAFLPIVFRSFKLSGGENLSTVVAY